MGGSPRVRVTDANNVGQAVPPLVDFDQVTVLGGRPDRWSTPLVKNRPTGFLQCA